jgi:hypothetical protein
VLVRAGAAITTGCGRIIRARVSTERAGASLIVTEQGTTRAGGAMIATCTVTRWTFSHVAIDLEHLRFGVERPVFLVRLTERADGMWRAEEAHACGRDRYDAELWLDGERLVLTWRIAGPRKGYAITTVYRPDPE